MGHGRLVFLTAWLSLKVGQFQTDLANHKLRPAIVSRMYASLTEIALSVSGTAVN